MLVSFLGLGRWIDGEYIYEETVYTLQGFPKVQTPFIQEALSRWFPGEDLLLLATPTTLQKTWPRLEARGLKANLREIPEGRSEAELWAIYQRLAEAILEKEEEKEAILPEKKVEVVLDVTHGLRSLPMVGLAALAFLRAARRVEVRHILYGAFEARDGDKTPVFDLLPLLSLLDWAVAARRFLDTGDARGMAALAKVRGRRPLNPTLNQAVKDLEALSTALAGNRALEAMKLAKVALGNLKRAGEALDPEHRPLDLLLPSLRETLKPLVPKAETPKAQLLALWRQVKWYWDREQWEKAVGLAREWLVGYYLWRQGKEGDIFQDNSLRQEAEEALNDLLNRKDPLDPKAEVLRSAWGKIAPLRNDLLHFGFRNSPIRAQALAEDASTLLEEVKGLALSLEAASS